MLWTSSPEIRASTLNRQACSTKPRVSKATPKILAGGTPYCDLLLSILCFFSGSLNHLADTCSLLSLQDASCDLQRSIQSSSMDNNLSESKVLGLPQVYILCFCPFSQMSMLFEYAGDIFAALELILPRATPTHLSLFV